MDSNQLITLADAYRAMFEYLDAGIMAMIEHDGPVMVDCRVSKEANCFPMIPSGAAHTEMLLYGDMVEGTMDDEAKALV